MITNPRPWLPANALRDNALSVALTAYAERWCTRWFCAPKPASLRMSEVRDRASIASDCLCWTHPKGGVLLAMSAAAHVPLASAMLGLETGAHRLTAQDHAVLRRLAASCAQDFLHGVLHLFGRDASVDTTSARSAFAGFRFAVSLGAASQLLDLCIDNEVATVARRTLLDPPPNPTKALAPRNEAVGRQPIRVGAMIGVGKLGLGDLRTLACGDVLVLDRGPKDALALAVDGVPQPDAPCSIVEDNGALCMRLNGFDHGSHL